MFRELLASSERRRTAGHGNRGRSFCQIDGDVSSAERGTDDYDPPVHSEEPAKVKLGCKVADASLGVVFGIESNEN